MVLACLKYINKVFIFRGKIKECKFWLKNIKKMSPEGMKKVDKNE